MAASSGGLDLDEVVASLKPGAEAEGEENIEAEVLNLLRGLVHSVATRHVVESEPQVVRNLEAMQQNIWARDESKHSKRTANANRRASHSYTGLMCAC